MKERFNKYTLYISLGALLILKVMNENKDSWKENILNLYELVKDDLSKIHLIKTELICWEVKWTENKDIYIYIYIYICIYIYIYIYMYT